MSKFGTQDRASRITLASRNRQSSIQHPENPPTRTFGLACFDLTVLLSAIVLRRSLISHLALVRHPRLPRFIVAVILLDWQDCVGVTISENMTVFHPQSIALSVVLIVSLLPGMHAERHKQIAAANAHCNLDCLNDGYCTFTKYTDYPRKGDVGYYQSCTCRPGFGGGSCEKVIEECQAPHFKCHNGAPCERNDNGDLGCDCSFADAVSELAGYMCRKPSLQACDTLDENNNSFCTNGGVCLSAATASPQHLVFSEPTV